MIPVLKNTLPPKQRYTLYASSIRALTFFRGQPSHRHYRRIHQACGVSPGVYQHWILLVILSLAVYHRSSQRDLLMWQNLVQFPEDYLLEHSHKAWQKVKEAFECALTSTPFLAWQHNILWLKASCRQRTSSGLDTLNTWPCRVALFLYRNGTLRINKLHANHDHLISTNHRPDRPHRPYNIMMITGLQPLRCSLKSICYGWTSNSKFHIWICKDRSICVIATCAGLRKTTWGVVEGTSCLSPCICASICVLLGLVLNSPWQGYICWWYWWVVQRPLI